MRRRYFLGAVGIGGLGVATGCVDGITSSGSGGGDSGSKYDPDRREEMLLEESDFPSSWRREEPQGSTWSVAFERDDQRRAVYADVEIWDSVDRAKTDFDRTAESARNNYSPEELSIGNEGILWNRSDGGFAFFRESNAVGTVSGLKYAKEDDDEKWVADTELARTYAEKMYQHW